MTTLAVTAQNRVRARGGVQAKGSRKSACWIDKRRACAWKFSSCAACLTDASKQAAVMEGNGERTSLRDAARGRGGGGGEEENGLLVALSADLESTNQSTETAHVDQAPGRIETQDGTQTAMEVESVQDPSDLAEDPQSGGDTDQDRPCWQGRSSAGLGRGKQAEIPEPGCEIVACVLLFRKILLMPSEAMPIRISSEFSRELTNGLEDSSLVTITEQIRFPRLVGHLECGHSRGADSALIGRVGTLARLESVVSCAPSRHASRDSNEGDIDDVDDGSHGWADVTIFGAARFKIVALEPTSGLFHAIARIRVLPDEGSGSLTRIPSTATSIPDFVRQAFDPVSLCARIVASGSRLLRPFGKEDLAESFVLPRTRMETEKFSFWLARNLPLDMRTVRALLELNSTEHRLLEILKFVTGVEETLSCAFCNAALATTANVISMSEVGAAGSYMNAFGCTHQLLTLDKVPDARSRGAPSLEHTYFPGYAWTCIYCYQCEFHIGWKYEAVDTSCIPREFFGLLRSVLTTNLPGRHWL